MATPAASVPSATASTPQQPQPVPAAESASTKSPLAIPQWPPYAGYPLHLFPLPPQDDFKCGQCRQVLRSPLELPCEHLICRACYSPSSSSSSSSTTATAAAAATTASTFHCPVCHEPVSEEPRINRPVQSLIQKLHITCPYKQYGCQHKSLIGKEESVIAQHLEHCLFGPVVCAGCSSEVQRGSKKQHEQYECVAGKWQCEHCSERVSNDEADSARHRTNTFDRSLLCCHLRPCPNDCSLPAPASSVVTAASGRAHKRQREEESGSETKEAEPEPSPPSTAGKRTALPFWQMAAHTPVCPLAPVTCAVCSVEVQRRDFAQHFASSHPLKAVRIEVDGRKAAEEQKAANGASGDGPVRKRAEAAEKKAQELSSALERKQQEWEAERNAQRDSIQQLHAARQADQRVAGALQSQLAIQKAETEQLRQRLLITQQQQNHLHQQQQLQQQQKAIIRSSSPTAAQPRQQMNVDQTGPTSTLSPFAPRQPQASPAADSSASNFSLRLSTFQTTLGSLLCTNCLQPRFQLSRPGGTEPCGVFHPSERMLTADGKYGCCGRLKGSLGCVQRPMHIFDFDALQREFPEFRDKCHNLRASTTGVSSGRAEASSMQM